MPQGDSLRLLSHTCPEQVTDWIQTLGPGSWPTPPWALVSLCPS